MQINGLAQVTLQPADLTGGNTSARAKDAKLVDGASQFEAMLLQQMLKPLQFGGAPGDDEENSGGAGDTIRSMGTEALSKSIAQAGGFGVAKKIVSQIEAQRERTETKQHSTKV
jgi:flagellar protein FlgJ